MFYADNRYGSYALRDQFLFNYGWGLVYFWGFYFFMGKPAHYLASHNVPYVWSWFVYHTSLASIEAVFLTFLVQDAPSFSAFVWYVISTAIVIYPAVFICGLYFEKDITNFLSDEPEKAPYWMPYKKQEVALNDHLPKPIRGKILRVEAMNQYIQVITEKGEADLRMSLQNATDLIPEAFGLRVHRSVWLNWDEMQSLVYVDGNPRVELSSGERFPVSRSKAEILKKRIG